MINKKIVKNFLLDHLYFTIIYFVNSFLIMLFYYISIGRDTEILYPASISLFIYLIFIVIKGVKYYIYNCKITNSINNPFYELKASTREQKEVITLITSIHGKYAEKISTIELQNKNNKRFISQWIHNMKTPITVIDLIVQKSQRRGDIIPRQGIEDIKQENRRLLHSLEQVLNLMRIENFTIDYEPETIDLIASVKKIINSMKNDFVYNNVFPKLRDDNKPMLVLSDGKWNEAMISQLISNAIKYSKSENKAKSIYFIFEREKQKTSLTIRDEGVGIPVHDLQRVFKPFFTGENGRQFGNATGIGLFFCREVSSRLGHEIAIKSKVGVGTEVTVTYLSKL